MPIFPAAGSNAFRECNPAGKPILLRKVMPKPARTAAHTPLKLWLVNTTRQLSPTCSSTLSARERIRHGASNITSGKDTLHEVLVAENNVPPDDRFQVIESLAAPRFIYDCHYLSGGRSDRYVLLNIVAGRPRSAEQERATYRVLSERLQQRLNLDPNDLMIIIQQTQPEDWSFSGGKMFDLGMIV